MNPYLEPVIATICEQLCISDENLDEDSHLEKDCGLDSLNLSELAIALETEFDVIVEDETLESWETVGDIATFLLEELGDPVEE